MPQRPPQRPGTPVTGRIAEAARAIDYRLRTWSERFRFHKCAAVHALPDIFHYWSNRYLRPKLEIFGTTHPEALFLKYLELCRPEGAAGPHRFLSIGAGDCAIEVGLARALAQRGGPPFVIECLDVNKAVLERGRKQAEAEGVAAHIVPVVTDINRWRPLGSYDAVIANQSLHHIIGLENVFVAPAHRAAALHSGKIKPAHMLAVMRVGREGENGFADDLSPQASIRWPD